MTAVRTLTILPFPGQDAANPSSSLGWFPAIGLLLGGIIMLVIQALVVLPVRLPPAAVALAVLVTGTLLTRGFHLDGLADWADGWWGGYDRERILAIMKDSHIGTFGVIALVFALIGKLICYAHLLSGGGHDWIALSLVLARMGMVDLAVAHPYARPGGGTAARFVGEARLSHWLLAVGFTMAVLALWPGLPLVHAAIGLLAALLVARLFGMICRRRIGGVTGDILGTGNECIELTILFLGILLHATANV